MAGTEVGSLHYDLNIDDKNLKKQLDGADRNVKGFGNKANGHFSHALGGAKKFAIGVAAFSAVAGAATIAFGVSAVKAYKESEAVAAQTNAVLKATGGVAGVTAKQVDKLARSLQFSSMYSDEQVASAENILLTFKAVGKDIFPRATQAAVDMSTALKTDLNSAMTQLGKAMQDPVKGAMALSKQGSISKVELQHLKEMAASGSTVFEQQTYILEALEGQYKGSAKAALKAAGPFAIMGKLWDDAKEKAGKFISKAITPLMEKLLDLYVAAGGIDGIMKSLRETFGKVTQAVKDAWTWYKNLSGPLQFLISPIGFLVVHFNAFLRVIKQVANIIMTWFWPSIKALGNSLLRDLWPALKQVWDAVVRLWHALNPALMTAIKIIAIALGVALVAAIWIAINVLRIAIKIFSAVISVISNVIKWVSNLIKWFGNLVGGTINVIRQIGSWFGRLPGYVRDAVNSAVAWFRRMPGKILNAIGNVGKLLYNAGKNLIGGFINGIVDKFKDLATKVKDAVGNAVSSVKNFLGIHSPSKVFEGIGKNVTEGFVKGIIGNTGMVANAMGDMSKNIMQPKVMLSGRSAANAPTTASNQPMGSPQGGTTINIGQVNNKQDENWVIRRMDMNQRLQLRGGAPA